MKEPLYDWFEREWEASINNLRIQTKQKFNPPLWGRDLLSWEDTAEVSHVPIMKIEMSEHDLKTMIRGLKHHRAHEEVQRRYPHLREAYMNYLTQVYLTVDEMPD
jgi:hypothetical protein